ncbi:hypothetical protein BGZ83_000047 [Gryganskiella cystojenkinii]|nr:hypothetical protein BGZ83_000047 [Gryganskiella cystojenkinii]
MSGSRDNSSRTNSVYVDAPEFLPDSTEDNALAQGTQPPPSHTALIPQTPEPEEDDDDDGDNEEEDGGDEVTSEESDSDTSDPSETRGRSRTVESEAVVSNDNEDGESSDEEIVMRLDPSTGLQRATSVTRTGQVRARSTSIADRLRRQHRRMTTSVRTSATARSGSRSSRPSSQVGGSPSAVGATAEPLSSSKQAPIVDEKAQTELRRKIMDIQRDPTISFADKARMIQNLMSSKWGAQKTEQGQNGDTTADDLKRTYNDEEGGHLGCKHYRRGCKLKANCCGRWFNCRFCHDKACDHAIVRSETKEMLCMHCSTIQPAAQNCSSCKAQLARYYCDTCKLWDDAPGKNIYHCVDCGICRVGKGLGKDFYHCKTCNVCLKFDLKNNHKCIERNLESDCPICGEYMFTSTSMVIFMPCGHSIHHKCHDEYVKTSYQCPTCWKALGDMSLYYAKIDSLLASQTMPPEYANIVSMVLCNDCEVKSEAPYHFLYHKCKQCNGYNTKVLETFRRVADGQVELVENATVGSVTGTSPENNTSGAAIAGSSSSSSAAHGGSSSGATATSSTTPVRLMDLLGSVLMDGNAVDDMSFRGSAGSSGNSAP